MLPLARFKAYHFGWVDGLFNDNMAKHGPTERSQVSGWWRDGLNCYKANLSPSKLKRADIGLELSLAKWFSLLMQTISSTTNLVLYIWCIKPSRNCSYWCILSVKRFPYFKSFVNIDSNVLLYHCYRMNSVSKGKLECYSTIKFDTRLGCCYVTAILSGG